MRLCRAHRDASYKPRRTQLCVCLINSDQPAAQLTETLSRCSFPPIITSGQNENEPKTDETGTVTVQKSALRFTGGSRSCFKAPKCLFWAIGKEHFLQKCKTETGIICNTLITEAVSCDAPARERYHTDHRSHGG